MSLLFLEGAGGISGDMTVAALLGLGGSRAKLDAALKSLSLEGFSYAVRERDSYGIAGVDFDVRLDADEGHAASSDAAHHHHELPHDHHHHDHSGHHGHDHTHLDRHAPHEHRNLSDVFSVIDRGELGVRARELAKRTFTLVAEAEAEAHGKPLDQVHFHEVGAIDSIVDIVAAAVLIEDLGIEECVVTGLTEGRGTVLCQHGELPVPVPAVLNVARRYGIPLRTSSDMGEKVTPTGIALAAALRTRTELPPVYSVERVGIGLGKRDFGHANFLRAMLLREEAPAPADQIFVVECNVDDSTGEELGFAMDALFKAGAKDVHYIPCLMKKNRPGQIIKVIVAERDRKAVEETLFRCTSTIGIRRYPVERTCLSRSTVEVALPQGTVCVKRCEGNGILRFYPEFESVRALALASGEDIRSISAQAVAALSGAE